jgi:hypothetical protein
MRKLATMFLLIVTLGMVFAGAASAQEVTTTVLDENGNPVDVTCPGDVVVVDVVANNTGDTNIDDPWVNLTVLKNSSLAVDPTTAVMTIDWGDGTTDTYTNDVYDFFFWWEDGQTWVWDIGAIEDLAGYLAPGESAQLDVAALVKETGAITVTSEFYTYYPEDEPILLDTDSYTFLSVPCHHCHGATVPMQNTGAPLAALALGMLSIIGGAVYGKLR